MTIVFFDGFDTYKIGMTDAYNNGISLTEKWSCGSTTTLSGGFMTLGQAGAFLPGTPPGQYLLSNATDGNNNRLIANIAPSTNICVGFHYSPTITIGANNNIVTLYNSGSVTDATVIQLITTSSNYLAVRAASSTLASTAKPLSLDKWFFIEIQMTVTGRAVSGNVYIDGTNVLTFSSATALSATASFQNIDSVSIGKGTSAWQSSAVIQRYDNFYITDGERLGEIFIPAFTPRVDPISKTWLANSNDGVNYTTINDIGSNDSMASNVVSNTVGDKDLYQLNIPTNLASFASSVKGVSTFIHTSGSTIGTTGVNTVMRNTSTDTNVSSVNLEATRNAQLARSSMLITKPSNNTAWTPADLQVMRLGMESKEYVAPTSKPYLLSTGTNGVITNNSRAVQLSPTTPSSTGDYLQFNGASSYLLYSRVTPDGQPIWQFTPPFSIEWDMIVPNIPGQGTNPNKTVISFGRNDNNTPYGEIAISFDVRGIGCYFQTAGGGISPAAGPFSWQWFANGSNNATATTPPNPTPGQSYKYGLMLYSDMTTVYARGYLDGVQKFQAAPNLNYDSRSTGLSIGGSTDYGSTSRFIGQIANLRMDNSLFWPI